MKHTLISALLGIALAAACAAESSAAPKDPTGTYLTQDQQARMRVEFCGPQRGYLCGYLVWLKAPADANGSVDVDEHNPDPAKQTRPLLGAQIILGLAPNEDDRYEGQIYDADRGKTFDVEVWREGRNELKVKGCLVAFLCQTQTWNRVSDVAPGELTGATGEEGGPRPDPEWAAAATGGGAEAPAQ